MRIKQLLDERGMTAKELAASSGLTEMGLSKIITGKSSPSVATIEKIAAALNVRCGELFDDYEIERQSNGTEKSIRCPKCGTKFKVEVTPED